MRRYFLGVTSFLGLIIPTNFCAAEFNNHFKKDSPTKCGVSFDTSYSTGKMSVVSVWLTILSTNLVIAFVVYAVSSPVNCFILIRFYLPPFWKGVCFFNSIFLFITCSHWADNIYKYLVTFPGSPISRVV